VFIAVQWQFENLSHGAPFYLCSVMKLDTA